MTKKTRKIIEIILLILLLVYLILFVVDYFRAQDSTTPLIVLKTKEKEYDDGYVKEYISIGWIYREYRRETITDNEIAPFWSDIKMDDVLIRDNEDNLPEIETDYVIPNNPYKDDQINDVLFFYDENKELLGTYKCLNSTDECHIAISKTLEYDNDSYQKYPMSIIESRYVFIDDYKNSNTPAEEQITYLLDLKANRIIAAYQSVRYATLKNELGLIDNSKYIVKKNDLWGIDQVIKGKVTNNTPFDYEYIKYEENTNLYLIKKDKWQTLDANTSTMSAEFDNQITSTYVSNNTYLIGINIYDKNTSKTSYNLYNLDGSSVINKDNIDYLDVFDDFILYTNNLKLYIIDYTGNDKIEPLTLYFNNYDGKYGSVLSYYLDINIDEIKITIPQRNYKDRKQNEYYYNKETWELTKTHLDVYETD